MKSVNYGILFNNFKDAEFDCKKLEEEITTLMQDEDVTKKSGIYEYVLTRNEKYLNIRAFTNKQKRESYERQKRICVKYNVEFEINEMEADHITPWCEGGRTKVSHLADKKMKSLLHMVSLTAIKYNPELIDYYTRKKAERKHTM